MCDYGNHPPRPSSTLLENMEADRLHAVRQAKKLRAQVADLKARLKAAREAWFDDTNEGNGEWLEEWERKLWFATDTRRKNWRKP